MYITTASESQGNLSRRHDLTTVGLTPKLSSRPQLHKNVFGPAAMENADSNVDSIIELTPGNILCNE
jgi:hypothetical protein